MTEEPEEPLDHQAQLEPDAEATVPLPDLDGQPTVPLPPPVRTEPAHRPPTALIAGLVAGVLIAGGVLAVLVGRIGREPAAASEGPPQRFASPQALVEYLDRRGFACNSFEAVGDLHDGTGQARCVAGGARVGVGVYAIHSEVEAQWSALAGSRDPLFMALGENWTVDGPADWTKRVADALDAQYRAQA
ncbi:hypothetical protein [Dactylosporangium sp. CA-139066]|uniref:hypothetical protein n=1 Tax=Dactylosporangium sp. CA-139066 TaxID=3239930 RepID=UPI003D8C88D3